MNNKKNLEEDGYNRLIRLVPLPGESKIDWDKILCGELSSYGGLMSMTPQNQEWHGEGSVLEHTKMVCENLIQAGAWQELERRKQEEVFLAALLHDMGKTICTRWEGGVPVSPNHTLIGDRMARRFLWHEFGINGSYKLQQFRETVCSLIRYHSLPFHFFHEKTPEFKVIRCAAHGELVADFSNELLSILVEADIRGRIAQDREERLEHLYYFREIAKESECYKEPLRFPSPYSRYAYLSGRRVMPGQDLYNDTWGTVIVLAGLPGTGKDTYIQQNYPDWPMVSLDRLRQEIHVSAEEPQGRVVNAAYDLAREYLRKKQPFVWNATNFTPALRGKIVDLLTGYQGAVKIVYLETEWETMLSRNRNRGRESVPESVIEAMLKKLVPPDVCEAHEVEWVLG